MAEKILNKIIELSSEQVANRRNIKWIVHQIGVENLNGCNFKEPYVTNNIDSAKNMMLFANFLDSNNDNIDKKMYCSHGEEEVSDGDGYIFPNVNIVGCATNAYVCDLEFDGVIGTYLVAEGYLQEDKCKAFIEQLQEELDGGNPPKTSIEIVAKKDTTGIVYEAGKWTATNRTPIEYDYNGSCFVINPSDKSAVLLEINQAKQNSKELNIKELSKEEEAIKKNTKEELNKEIKNKKEVVKKMAKKKVNKKVELNELSIDDIRSIIADEFNEVMTPSDWKNDWEYREYWVFTMYATRAIVQSWDDSSIYYSVPYFIDGNGEVVLNEATRVEPAWNEIAVDPNDDEKEAPIKIDLSAVKTAMIDKKKETNACKGGNMMEENEKKVQELSSKVEELNKKVEELNSTMVEANKTLEVEKSEKIKMTEELNTLREEKAKVDAEAKKVEVNSYFENEIKKNGFTEIEINSLKSDYVDKTDLDGLKKAEMELCVKKIKEINKTTTELNSKKEENKDLFMAIHNTEKSEDDYSDLFAR